jgi:hypothetical protein
MAKALKKVKEKHSDATFDDAKDYYVMLSLNKKISPIHGKGKITGSQKKKRDKYVKYETYVECYIQIDLCRTFGMWL